jgi:hypothetical protein
MLLQSADSSRRSEGRTAPPRPVTPTPAPRQRIAACSPEMVDSVRAISAPPHLNIQPNLDDSPISAGCSVAPDRHHSWTHLGCAKLCGRPRVPRRARPTCRCARSASDSAHQYCACHTQHCGSRASACSYTCRAESGREKLPRRREDRLFRRYAFALTAARDRLERAAGGTRGRGR